MSFFEAFGKIKESNLASGAVQKLSAAFAGIHYGALLSLHAADLERVWAPMYAAGGEFTQNHRQNPRLWHGAFAAKAMEIYCK